MTSISVGGSYSACGITGGTVKCWGYNAYGQLGDGSTSTSASLVSVSGVSGNILFGAAGGDHTCVYSSNDNIYCWGRNNLGQLGNGSTTDASVAQVVANIKGVKSLSLGSGYTCATIEGDVRCWGNASFGQLGYGNTTSTNTFPASGIGLSGVSSITAGENHPVRFI